MASLLDTIRAQKTADVPLEERLPLIVDPGDWARYDGTNATCPWELIGVNVWRHVRTGEEFVWGQPFVLPWEA